MDTERSGSYLKFVMDEKMRAAQMLSDIQNTPRIQDYAAEEWTKIASPVNDANKVIAFVAGAIINPAFNDLITRFPDRIDSTFGAVQMCLIPFLADALGGKFNIDSKSLMIAATHYGVSEMSNLYQKANEKDKEKLKVYALFFADAQARLIGFRTSTTLLALDLEDKAFLRLQNIAIITEFENDKEMEKAGIKAIFEGHKVTRGKGMYFVE